METNVTHQRLAWSLKELSAALGLSVGFLRKQVNAGSLPVKRVGRRVLVLDKQLKDYLAVEPAQQSKTL